MYKIYQVKICQKIACSLDLDYLISIRLIDPYPKLVVNVPKISKEPIVVRCSLVKESTQAICSKVKIDLEIILILISHFLQKASACHNSKSCNILY